MQRLLDEFISNRLICLGEPAARFVQLEPILWRVGSNQLGKSSMRPAESSDHLSQIQSAEALSERSI